MNVTDKELIDFMVSQNINYKKTKNNKPDMRCKYNKEYRNILCKNKILEKNKKENLHSFTTEKEINYRKEIANMSDEDIELLKTVNEPCVICGEIMKNNHSVLKCKHAFCNNCMISHFRIKDNCPLCRTTVCEKPKTVEPMTEELIKGIINYEIWNNDEYNINSDIIQGNGTKTEFSTTIYSLLTYYEMVCDSGSDFETAKIKENIKQIIFKVITYMTFNVSSKISNFYDEQL